MTVETFKKHLLNLKQYADGDKPLPKIAHGFGNDVFRLKTKQDYKDEISEIGRQLERRAKEARKGAIDRLEAYKEIFSPKAEKSKEAPKEEKSKKSS